MTWALVWTVGAMLVAGAVLFRFGSRRGRQRGEVWSTCLAISPIGTTVAALALGNQDRVNRLLHIRNVAMVLVWTADAVACAAALMFTYAARVGQPRRWVLAARAASGGAVAVTVTGLWSAAPIHGRYYPDALQIPLDPFFIAANIVFLSYLSLTMLEVIRAVRVAVHRPPAGGRGARISLFAAGAGGVAGLFSAASWIVSLALSKSEGSFDHSPAVIAAQTLEVVAMLFFSASAVSAIMSIKMLPLLRSLRLIVVLNPLWQRMRQLYPAVALPASRLTTRPALRAHRMRIEIADALRLVLVPAEIGTDSPIHAVARVLKNPLSEGRTAAAVLPEPTSRAAEDELLLALARAYSHP